MKTERPDLLKATIERLIVLLTAVKVAEDNLEGTLTQISQASRLLAEGTKNSIFNEEQFQRLQNSIGDKSQAIINAREKLEEELSKSDKKIQSAFSLMLNKDKFILETSTSRKCEMLLEEILKNSPQLERQQPIASAARPPPGRPEKKSSAPVMFTEQEKEFRKEWLNLKGWCSGNEYYNLLRYEALTAKLNDIQDRIIGNNHPYKNINEIRTELCAVLNTIIGENKPTTGMFQSKEFDKRLTKLAMCVQQLGGKVENQQFEQLANKKFGKKKIEPKKLYMNGGLRIQPEQKPEKKASLTKKR